MIGVAYTAALRNIDVPPTWSTWAWVRITRFTGRSIASIAAAKGSHCDRTISVSTTVRPSSSAMTPALLTPVSPPGCSHTQTPSASSSSAGVDATA